MSRLPIALVVACACATTTEPTKELEAWLDNWVEVRTCLAATTVDTKIAIATNALLGRDCGAALRDLSAPIVGRSEDLPQELIDLAARVATDESLEPRAAAVDRLDAFAFAVGAMTGHPISMRLRTSLPPVLPQPWNPFEPGERFTMSFNAGNVHAVSTDHYTLVEKLGTSRTVWFQRSEQLALPSLTVTVSGWLGSAIGNNQVVLSDPRDNERYAYAVERTHDGGRHWKRELMVPGGRLVRAWQDARTGEIVVSVKSAGQSYIQRLTAAGVGPLLKSLDSDHLEEKSCVRDGHVWTLHGESLVSVTSGTQTLLTGWANEASLDCHGATALVLRHEPEVVERCDVTCKRVFEPPSGSLRGVIGVLDDGRWIYASTISRVVVGVWVEGRDPEFWRLPSFAPTRVGLRSIAVVAGRPALVFMPPPHEDGAYLVELPIDPGGANRTQL